VDAAMSDGLISERVEDIEIHLLLEGLYRRYHYDFRNYAQASIKRRLRQAREQLGYRSISALQHDVLHDPEMLPRLLSYLTVQVSEVFRDPSYFKAIREKVIPHLRTYPSLRIWIAGCSTGEELYSFVILFREEGLEQRTLFYATDINQDALAKAEAGIYDLERFQLFTENHRKSGENPRFRTITPPPMARAPSTRACATGWCSPITALSPMRSLPRCISSPAAMC
jgi:chemotaxis protein methyltransferase CheR